MYEDFNTKGVDRLYIKPPENRGKSDSEDKSAVLLVSLTDRQLQGAAEVVLHSAQRVVNDDTPIAELQNQQSNPLDDFDKVDVALLITLAKKKSNPINWLEDSELPDITI